MKNLLATLMVLLIIMGTGMALAGDTTLRVYGKAHTSLNFVDDGDQSAFTLASNASRFGIKGGIELNDKVEAIYQLENALDIADGGGELATRNSFVGIRGDFGTFLAGVHDTPLKTLARGIALFRNTIGDFRTTTLGYDQRLSNLLVYIAPNRGKWGGQLAYQLDQNDWQGEGALDDYSSATAFSAMVHITTSDFFLGAAYETWSRGYFDSTPGDDDSASGAFRIGAKYTGERFVVSGLFQSVSNLWNTADDKGLTFGLELVWKAAGKWHLKGSGYNAGIEPDGAESDNFSQFALGIDHVFAPRTTFYLVWAMIINGDTTAAGIGGYDVNGDGSRDYGNGFGGFYAPALADDGTYENPMAISLGVVHNF